MLGQHYLLKCTIDETFQRLGNPFSYLNENEDETEEEFSPWGKLTMQGKEFSWDKFIGNNPDRFHGKTAPSGEGDGKTPPPIGNDRGNSEQDDGPNGGSFIVVDFSTPEDRK